MIYYKPEEGKDGIRLCEPGYHPDFNKKTESVFAQCSGTLGIRACTELRQLEETRGAFIGGFYHKAGPYEVTELVNCPDVTQFEITVNGIKLLPDVLPMKEYQRCLDLKTGELNIKMVFDTEGTGKICLETHRFASKKYACLFCHQLSLWCEKDAEVELVTGINGQISNSGVSHFQKCECRVLDREYLSMENECDDGQTLKVLTGLGENEENLEGRYFLKRRSIYGSYQRHLKAGDTWKLEKYTLYDSGKQPREELKKTVAEVLHAGYQSNMEKHKEICDKFWKMAEIEIEGASLKERTAVAFAQYHMAGMVPWNGCEYSAGAKGLTGEGYKGHVFWDTELFLMPMFTAMFPEVARNLLEYRYHRMEGARKKAREYGYEGAMYPWESAQSGEEETPLCAAINIYTGKAAKVWSGMKEHHVTADIIHGLLEYYQMTGDNRFMEQYGNEMILETAKFWYTRAVWSDEKNRYEIKDIIGPDEYTEHVDNNTYTNYMAYQNVKAAVHILQTWKHSIAEEYIKDGWQKKWSRFLDKLYLPVPDENGMIPQDDTFLNKKELENIEKYKYAEKKQLILTDFSRSEVVDMQVLKQADVVMLLNLFPDLFEKEIVQKNVEYYEKRTIHDSSLSLCAHAEAMAAIGAADAAWGFFEKAMEIDLCDNSKDSIDGIHAASLGGVLNCVLRGFAGMRMKGEQLGFYPQLPSHWKKIRFHVIHRGRKRVITVMKDLVTVDKGD